MNLDESKTNELERRIEHLEFRQQLLFKNSSVDRFVFEYNITREQYQEIMNLLDEYRKKIGNKIGNKDELHNSTFEKEIYQIVPEHEGDYHMCEYLTRTFMEDGRWEEVFPALYGKMDKYKNLI